MDSVDQTTNKGLAHTDVVPEAASQIFSMTCGVELTPAEAAADVQGEVIVAVISIVGDVDWAVFLGLPKGTAVAAAEKFAGFEIPFDSPDMGDAVGELTNIFAGQVKALLDTRQITAEISLPSVMRCGSIEVLLQRGSATVKNCFSSPMGSLWTGVVAGKTAMAS